MENVLSDDCWAIIPARANSKGVAGKNIKLLNSKPLIGYAIESLKASGVFDEVYVTSDGERILDVAKEFGARTYLRDDEAESNDVVMPDVPTISLLRAVPERVRPKFTFMVQCTSPFVQVETYRKAHQVLVKNSEKTIFAAVEANAFLWRKSNKNSQSQSWKPVNHPFHMRVGRQFKGYSEVHETGAFYGFKTEQFILAEHRFFSEAMPVLLDTKESIDINTYQDWLYAEYLTKN